MLTVALKRERLLMVVQSGLACRLARRLVIAQGDAVRLGDAGAGRDNTGGRAAGDGFPVQKLGDGPGILGFGHHQSFPHRLGARPLLMLILLTRRYGKRGADMASAKWLCGGPALPRRFYRLFFVIILFIEGLEREGAGVWPT